MGGICALGMIIQPVTEPDIGMMVIVLIYGAIFFAIHVGLALLGRSLVRQSGEEGDQLPPL